MNEEKVAFTCLDCKIKISVPNTEVITCSNCGKKQDLKKHKGLVIFFNEKDALVGQ